MKVSHWQRKLSGELPVLIIQTGFCPIPTNESNMKRPNKKKQQKDLARGKKKAAAQLKKNSDNKVKAKRDLAEKIKDRQAERETFKMKDAIRRIQNQGLTIRNR